MAAAEVAVATLTRTANTTTAAKGQTHLFSHCAGSLCTRVVSAQLSFKVHTKRRAGKAERTTTVLGGRGECTYRLLGDNTVGGLAAHGLGRDGLHLNGLLGWGRHCVGGLGMKLDWWVLKLREVVSKLLSGEERLARACMKMWMRNSLEVCL